jgi:hypothetical protein
VVFNRKSDKEKINAGTRPKGVQEKSWSGLPDVFGPYLAKKQRFFPGEQTNFELSAVRFRSKEHPITRNTKIQKNSTVKG